MYLLIKLSIVKFLTKSNNNILTNKNYFNYLYFIVGKFFFYNNSVFYKNYILSSFFKRFFLFNNFFSTLSFFKKFTWNKSCKLPIRIFFKKKFKYIKDDTRIKIIPKRPSFKKIKYKKGMKKWQRKNLRAESRIRTVHNTDIFKQFLNINNTNTIDNKGNNAIVVENVSENTTNSNKNNYFFLNYLNFFNFFLKNKKLKVLKNSWNKKYLFLYNIFFIEDVDNDFRQSFFKSEFYNRKVDNNRKFIFLKNTLFFKNFTKSDNKKRPIFFKKKFLIINNTPFYEHFKNSLVLLLSGGMCRLEFLESFFFEFSNFFKNDYLTRYITSYKDFFTKNYIKFDNFFIIELFSTIFIKKLASSFDFYSISNKNKNDLIVFLILFFKKNYNYCNKIDIKTLITDFYPIFRVNKDCFFREYTIVVYNDYTHFRKSKDFNLNEQINSLYDLKFSQNNFFFDLDFFNFIFFKINEEKIYQFLKNFYFFKKLEIFFFYNNIYTEVFGGWNLDIVFISALLNIIFFNKLLITNNFYPTTIIHEADKIWSHDYLKPLKNKFFKKLNKKKMRIKFPTFRKVRKKKLKYKKIYKLILKDFFPNFIKYNLTSFFKNINSSYGFISLNFFFFFLNSIFIEEQIANFEHLEWDLTTTVNLKQIKKRLINNSNDHLLYNNHLPILTDHKHLKVKFINSVRGIASLSLNKFHQIFFVSLFELLFKKRFFIRYESNFFRKYKPKSYARTLINAYKNVHWKILRSLHLTELVEIIWYSFQFRDLRLLNNWLKKIMPMLKLKHHKVLIDKLKNLLEKNQKFLRSVLRLNGFFFKIKGKISVTGNAKKRNAFIRFGSIDLSSKSLKLDYEEGEINTRVGILGYKMFLSY